MKKTIIFLTIVYFLTVIFPVNTFAIADVSKVDSLLNEVEKKLWLGERVDGKQITGMKSNGDPVYTIYPKMTDDMIRPLITGYKQKFKNDILSLGELSSIETNKVADIIKSWNFSCKFLWENNKVVISIYPEFDFSPIVVTRQKNEINNAAEAFFQKYENKPSVWARPAVKEAIERGLVPERILSNFQAPITREEFAVLFVNTVFAWYKNNTNVREEYNYDLDEYLSNLKAVDFNFKDVNNREVKAAYLMGFVNGATDSLFMPDKKITRQEAAVMLVNYFQRILILDRYYPRNNITDLDKAAPWAKDSLLMSYYNLLITGSSNNREGEYDVPGVGTIDPLGYFTREQAIVIANRIYQKNIAHMPVLIRGAVTYDPSIEFEVSKNGVIALSLKERYFNREDGIIAKNLLSYEPFNAVSKITKPEQITAMTLGNYHLINILWDKISIEDIMRWIGLESWMTYGGTFSKEISDALFSGKNHLIDFGWSTIEINGDEFIYKYSLKDNGIHSLDYYEGTKFKPLIYKLIR